MMITDAPTKITDDLWAFGTPFYPLFLFQGDGGSAIFEGAVGAMGPLADEQMNELGVDKTAVKQIVVTHAHPDHVMAIPGLRDFLPEAQVVASDVAAKTLSFDKAVSFFCKIDAALTEALLEREMIAQRHRPKPLEEMQIGVDRVVGEGDVIEVGRVSFNVLATPGHSDCSLSFHQPDRGLLFVGDVPGYYMPTHDAYWANYFMSYATYMESIRRMAELKAEILCLGHNAVVTGADDVAAFFDAALRATEACHCRILEETKAGRSVREIAETLGAEVHQKLPLLPVDFFQKNCGLLVKQSLKHEDNV